MSVSALSVLLLWAFALPVLVTYRLLPVPGEPYLLHTILFILLGFLTIASVYPSLISKKFPLESVKTGAFIFVVCAVFFGSLTTLIIDRGKIAPGSSYNVHDIIVQLEVAPRFLSADKNPYKETYVGTALEQWGYSELGVTAVNPALYHFVMPPWYLIFSFPVYAAAMRTVGFFDGRMPLLLTLLGTLVICWLWFRDKGYAKLAILLALLSPAVAAYHLEGRSDGFAFFWLLAAMFFLEKGRLFWSAIIMALAIMSKQTIWFAVPFYILFVSCKYRRPLIFARSMVPTIIVMAVVTVPFLLWDTKAFLDSTVFYLSGASEHAYPISGYGFGMLLYSIGIIKDIHQYFPFWFWQALFGVPTLIWSLVFLKRKPTMSRLLMLYGLTLFVVWYFSRYFNNSHLSYIATIFSLGMVKGWDEESANKE